VALEPAYGLGRSNLGPGPQSRPGVCGIDLAPDVYILVALVLVAYNVFMTIARRRERQLYVSLWYFMGSLIWFPLVYLIGNAIWVTSWNAPAGAAWGGVLTGLNDAIANCFYGHNVVGLWFTTIGVGIVCYLPPKMSGRRC